MTANSTSLCPKEIPENLPSLFQNGHIILQSQSFTECPAIVCLLTSNLYTSAAYHIGWIISGSFALVAVLTSFWLIRKHLQWYTNKREQRYIVRILFLVPIYALISFASFIFWNHATPLLLIRDAYEAIVLTSFFYLLLTYLSRDPEEQKMIFLKFGLSFEADQVARQKGDEIKRWLFPLKFVTWKPKDGLYFLQLMKWGVLQYCVIRPTTTLAAVILDYMGLYCENSWGLGWGHIYIAIIVSLSVTIAMYCLFQIYVSVAKDLASHKPLLKLFSIKSVVFLTFWQATFLSVLSWVNVITASKYMSTNDVIIAISAILETFEMMLFAFLHIRAFTYKCYTLHTLSSSKSLPPSGMAQWRSLGHAMDFRETFRELWRGWIYLIEKVRGQEPAHDIGTKRTAHYERAFGRQRPPHGKEYTDANFTKYKERTFHPANIEVERRVEVVVEGQRQWLGLGRYGRHTLDRRERSAGLEEQIDQELERRGYLTSLNRDPKDIDLHPAGQHSWWRSLYSRLSQATPEAEDDANEIPTPQNSCRSHSYRRHSCADIQVRDVDCDIAFELSAGRPDGSAGARGQKVLGTTKTALPVICNEVTGDYAQLSNSDKEPQIDFAANTHSDFHLPRPKLAAIPTRYETGWSEPASPVSLQSHSRSYANHASMILPSSSSSPLNARMSFNISKDNWEPRTEPLAISSRYHRETRQKYVQCPSPRSLGNPTLPTTQGEDARSFNSDIRQSNLRREGTVISHGYRNEAFPVPPYHPPYPSPAPDTRLPAQPTAHSIDPFLSHMRPSTNSCTSPK